MKKIIFVLSLITTGIFFNSCESDITSLNVDPKHPQVLPSATLVVSAQQALLDQYLSTNVNRNISRMFTQQWSETTYPDETNYDMVTRPIPRNHYNYMMASQSATLPSPGVLSALRDARKFLATEYDADAAVKSNKEIVIELMSIFTWANLVDTYGDIPYSQAMQAPEIVEPKYDDAKTIYDNLFLRLNTAIAGIDTSKGSYNADIIYGGNMSNWKKMANSLKLRMAMNIADVDATNSKKYAEEAVTSGVFTSKNDGFGLSIYPTGQFNNPVYQDVVQSGRSDFLPSNIIVNHMNSNLDPRRAEWFTKNSSGGYSGGTYGSNNNYFNFSHLTSSLSGDSGVHTSLVTETSPGFALDYTEVMFLKAEGAARGYMMGGTAATLFASAIQTSMDEYSVPTTEATAYITAHPLSSNWKKSIGEEAWVAMFNKGFAAWNFTRRLDNPIFVNPTSSAVESVPVRMKYSDQEYVLNKAAVTAAATKIGGDKVSTKIFWDKY